MKSNRRDRSDVVLAAALAVLLSGYNSVVADRPWHRRWYVPANLAATVGLATLARARGLSSDELGLSAERSREGAWLGGAVGGAMACGVTVALAAPGTRHWLRDARLAGLRWPAVAYHAAVRVPAGTVLWEETAFRGVLLAALARVLSTRAAVATSSALFGLWHIRPTLDALHLNRGATGPRLTAIAVVGATGGTALAGVLLAGLRLRTGSLLAPMLVHLAANSTSTVAAAIALRLPCPRCDHHEADHGLLNANGPEYRPD